MIFAKQTKFRTDDPKELERQLIALENAVASAFAQLQEETYPRGKVVRVNGGETVNALIGGYYLCDTQSGNITLLLEKPKLGKHANTFLAVEKTHPANSLKLVPIDSGISSGGTGYSATGISLTTANAYKIFCNGENYRREF